jgi:hypothetical protein
MTHSPTAWRLDHERVLDTNNDPVALITDTDGEVIDWPWMYDEAPPTSYRHAEDNARLIAASPDLLAALEESVAELCLSINFNDAADLNAGEEPDGDPDTIAIVGRAEAAIAKAKGQKEDDV